MKAETLDLVHIFEPTYRYHVPLYQRPYVWERDKQWEPLWDDIRTVAERLVDSSESNDEIPHFVGAVVIAHPWAKLAELSPRIVIDGQQRLTTLQLVVAAARGIALEIKDEATSKRLGALLFLEEYLAPSADDRLKLIPTNADRSAFRYAVESSASGPWGGSDDDSHRTIEAYRYFVASIRAWVHEEADAETGLRIVALAQALRQLLRIVVISLEPGENAQAIFETMNARGTPLLAADLVKNHVFRRAEEEQADASELYHRYWVDFDEKAWRREIGQGRARRPRIDVFLGHWLVMESQDEVPWQELFVRFRKHTDGAFASVQSMLESINRNAAIFDGFDRSAVGSQEYKFFYRLAVLETTAFMPVVLLLFGPKGIGDDEERRLALRALESWLMRRLLCRMTTKNYNQVAIAMVKHLGALETVTADSVIEFLRSREGESQIWPSDALLDERFRTLPYYTALSRSRTRMVLEAIEEQLRRRYAPPFADWATLSIEHVMPQEWRPHWPLPEGADELAGSIDRDSAKHRIGNLTLVTQPLNSSLSNAAWIASPGSGKRDALRYFNTLLLNKNIVDLERWDEDAIATRTEEMLEAARRAWPAPDDERVWGPLTTALPALPVARPPTQSDDQGPSSTGDASAGGPVPAEVENYIRGRGGGPHADVARAFATAALGRPGVGVRMQQSRNAPAYFQVRSADHPYVIAYVHVMANDIRIDYRLPRHHDTYGRAGLRDNPRDPYAIQLYFDAAADLDVALRLLDDALAIESPRPSAAKRGWDEEESLLALEAADSELGRLAREVIAWTHTQPMSGFTRATRVPEIKPAIPYGDGWVTLFALTVEGRVYLPLGEWNRVPILSEASLRSRFLEGVHQATGVLVTADKGWPRIPAALLYDDEVRQRFLTCYEPIIRGLSKDHAEG